MNISHRSSKFGKDKSKLAKDNPHQGTEGWWGKNQGHIIVRKQITEHQK
jgi:hypothetical protein